jgi:hypothetical protein
VDGVPRGRMMQGRGFSISGPGNIGGSTVARSISATWVWNRRGAVALLGHVAFGGGRGLQSGECGAGGARGVWVACMYTKLPFQCLENLSCSGSKRVVGTASACASVGCQDGMIITNGHHHSVTSSLHTENGKCE